MFFQKKAFVTLLSLIVLALASFAVVAQTPFDPQSLISRWEGDYQNRYTSNTVVMVVKKVEGEHIYGTVNVALEPKLVTAYNSFNNMDLEFEGTISVVKGKPQIAIVTKGRDLDFQLTLTDKGLKGTMTGRQTSTIELHKVQ